MMNDIPNHLIDIVAYFTTPSKRFFIGYLLSAALLALGFVWVKRQHLTWAATKAYWLHPSARLDYLYFIVGGLIKLYAVVPLVLSAKTVMLWVNSELTQWFGRQYLPSVSREMVIISYTVTLFVVSDFSRYWLHRAMHEIPFLWVFHKVHHSAEILNPATFYRVHPVENFLFGLRYSLVVGLVTGVFVYLFGAKVQLWDVLGANVLLFTFNLLGGNLRHSHIELSYPAMLEKWFVSPRQHQLHHAAQFTRYNFGGYLAIWDNLFGTLKTTAASRDTPVFYGLGKKYSARYHRLHQLLLTPFIELGQIASLKKLAAKKLTMKKVAIFITCCLVVVAAAARTTEIKVPNDKSILQRPIAKPAQLPEKLPEQAAPAEQQKQPQPSQTDADAAMQKALKIALGTALFFDTNLSQNRSMSCATCHDPGTAFVDLRGNDVHNMASLGDDGKSLGDRNAPTVTYAAFSPHFQKNKGATASKSAFLGGQFWDGRAKDLAHQAEGPPINPIEMGLPDKVAVRSRLQENPAYIEQFKILYGEDVFQTPDSAYVAMADAIGEFEKTDLFAPFDSKYDRFLRGEYELTVLEDLGRSLFFSTSNTNCATCHKLRREDHPKETFTNFEYRNIGVPENTLLRAKNGVTTPDLGLYQNPLAQTASSKGLFKVPTLRNVAVTGPYMHNGVFVELRTVIEFYDQYNNPARQLNPETGKPWRKPEVPENVALAELKANILTDRKVDALIAFLNTLTDKRYEPMLEAQQNNIQ